MMFYGLRQPCSHPASKLSGIRQAFFIILNIGDRVRLWEGVLRTRNLPLTIGRNMFNEAVAVDEIGVALRVPF